MSGRLEGQVALVTGGGRGIGRAIAEELATAGAAVSLVARSKVELDEVVEGVTSAGGRAMAIVADVRDPVAVDAAVKETLARLGPVSLLVNNAGAPGPAGKDWEVDPDAWWECIESIVRGSFLFNRAVIPGMIDRGGGRIIHIVSTSGTRAASVERPGFATSIAKTAQIRLAEGLAVAAGPLGVAVFAVHPGVVKTRLLDSYGLDLSTSAFVPPERAASLCRRLASGGYDALAGRFLTIDDDLDAMLDRLDGIVRDQLYTLRLKT